MHVPLLDLSEQYRTLAEPIRQELEEILGRTVIVKSDAQLHQEKFDLA